MLSYTADDNLVAIAGQILSDGKLAFHLGSQLVKERELNVRSFRYRPRSRL